MRNFLRMALAAAVALPAAAAGIGDPALNELELHRDGTVAAWRVAGEDLLQPGVFSGFSVTDAMTGESAELTGTVTAEDGTLVFDAESEALELRLQCRFSPGNAGAILADCEVFDLARRDRAVSASFALSLQPGDWAFGNSWLSAADGLEKVAPGRGANQIDSFSGHGESQLPLGPVDNGRQAAALAHSMRKTRFFSYPFSVGADGVAHLGLTVDLGIVGDTVNFPHRAGFQFALLGGPSDSGLRGLVERYYRTFPECFEFKAPYGGWALWIGEEALAAAKACGMGYNQQEFEYSDAENLIPATQAAGLAAMQYSEPWAVWQPIRPAWAAEHRLPEDAPRPLNAHEYYVPLDTAAYRDELARDAGDAAESDRYPGLSRDIAVKVLENCAVESEDGEWIFHCYGGMLFPWTPHDERKEWLGGFILANSSPHLPHPNRYDVQINQVEHTARRLAGTGAALDAVYLDSVVFGVGWAGYNFRRDHFRYAAVPLTFARVNGRAVPAIHNALANAEFLEAFRRYCDEHDYTLFDNSWNPVIAYHIAYIDVLGAGEHVAEEPVSQADLRTMRFLANRKPVTMLDYRISFPDTTLEETDRRLNHALLYGIYCGTSDAWNKPEIVERLLQVCPRYAGLLDRINRAGWEILTRAEASAPALAERWGRDPAAGLYFTLYNPSEEGRPIELILRKADYPGCVFSGAEELVDAAPAAFSADGESVRIALELPARRTRLVRIF